nr:uncharacterized protein LOC131783342 [Pocillopora verrucosa]
MTKRLALLVLGNLKLPEIFLLFVSLSGLSFPYSAISQCPIRVFSQHTSRTFYNSAGEVFQQDAGAWITPLDYFGIQPFSDIPITASGHMAVYVSPASDIDLLTSSLSPLLPIQDGGDRVVYFIYYSHCTDVGPWELLLELLDNSRLIRRKQTQRPVGDRYLIFDCLLLQSKLT